MVFLMHILSLPQVPPSLALLPRSVQICGPGSHPTLAALPDVGLALFVFNKTIRKSGHILSFLFFFMPQLALGGVNLCVFTGNLGEMMYLFCGQR